MVSTNSIVDILSKVICYHPWKTILVFLLVFGSLFMGAKDLKFNDDYRMYFSEENKDLVAWEDLLNNYSRTDGLTVVVESIGGKKIFSQEVMPHLVKITKQLWQVPYVTRVDSLTNFQYMYADGEDLVVKNLIPSKGPYSQEFLQQRELIAYSEPSIKDRIISEDGYVSAFYLQMAIPKKDNAISQVSNYLHDIQKQITQSNPDLRIRLGGLVMLNSAFDTYARADMASLFPLMILIIIVLMVFLFKSPLITLALFFTMSLAVAATMGVAGYLGIELSPHSSIAPQVLLSVAIAMGVHLAMSFLRYMKTHNDKVLGVRNALKQNFIPLSFTSVTTSIGFFSMLLSDVPPLRHLGVMCGLGMVICFVSAIVFLPSLLMVLPLKIKKVNDNINQDKHWTTLLARFVLKNRLVILLISFVIFSPLIYALTNLEINDHPVQLFSKKTTFRQDAEFIDEKLAGTTTIQFSLESGVSGGINDPEYLRSVEKFKEHLLDDPLVSQVTVLSDTIKRINKSMNNNNDEFYKIPDSRDTIAQYLLFYEMNLPFGLELNNEINIDKSAVRLIAIIKSSPSKDILAFLGRTNSWLDSEITAFSTSGVSVLVMFSYMAERLAVNMFGTAGVAMFLIAVILMFALRNVKLGLLSLIPNLLPIAIVFGIWSIFGRTLDFASSLIFSMTLGVVVDDTVHFMNKFKQSIFEENMTVHDSIISTFRAVGPALLYSTIILSFGFLVFVTSYFHMNVILGLLTALTFMVALLLDLLLLPVILSFAWNDKLADKNEVGMVNQPA